MDLWYSQIRFFLPESNSEVSGVSRITQVCEAIHELDETSLPTPIYEPKTGRVKVTFATTDQHGALLCLRGLGHNPEVVSVVNLPTTDIQKRCANCGWIVSNSKCMRCM